MKQTQNENTAESQGELPKKFKTVWKWLLRSAVVVAVIAASVYFLPILLYSFSHESTDDAYVSGTIIPVSAEIKGRVTRVFIEDNRLVTAGEPLVEISSDDYTNAVQEKKGNLSALIAQKKELNAAVEEKKMSLLQANANLEAAKAEEMLAVKEWERYGRLLNAGAVSRSQCDNVEARCKVQMAKKEAALAAVEGARAALETLNARLETQNSRINEAESSLGAAHINLRRTVITAPITGRIAKKNVDPGKYVQQGQPLLTVVDERDIWVVANFKETQIQEMRIGQPVEIHVDAYPDVIFKGHINSFQPGTGAAFSMLPPENATGSFVKVVQRVPVKIELDTVPDSRHPLWSGLSATPYVDISKKKGLQLTDARS